MQVLSCIFARPPTLHHIGELKTLQSDFQLSKICGHLLRLHRTGNKSMAEMRAPHLLNLVKQHNAAGPPAHCLREFAPLIIALEPCTNRSQHKAMTRACVPCFVPTMQACCTASMCLTMQTCYTGVGACVHAHTQGHGYVHHMPS